MVEDAAFVEAESKGWYRPDRSEALQSSIIYLLTILCAAKGVKPSEIEDVIGKVESTRPRDWGVLTPEEQQEREDAETRRQVKGFIDQLKNRAKS